MKKIVLPLIFIFFGLTAFAQEAVFQIFKDTRVINSHSTEVLPAGKLDFRIGHRFGDIGGQSGGWQNFYGLEDASDVLIGFEYGVNEKMMIGINRTKGSNELRQNLNGLIKINLMQQEINGNKPFSLAVVGVTSLSTMPRVDGGGTLANFQKFAHRMAYHASFILSKKLSNRISLQFNGAWTYRNLVSQSDKNDLVSLGGAARIQMTKSLGLLIDANFPFSELRSDEEFEYYNPIGFGIEWETGGGHVFQMNFTNSRGLSETDFIPYSSSSWGDGEFRLGFTISRLFTLN